MNKLEETKEYTVYQLECERDSLCIYGQFYLPMQEADTYLTVIISHSFGGTHRHTAKYARVLAGEGIACYIYDFCGGSPIAAVVEIC